MRRGALRGGAGCPCQRAAVSARALCRRPPGLGRTGRGGPRAPPPLAAASLAGSGHKMVVGRQHGLRWPCQSRCAPAPRAPAPRAQRPPALPGMARAAGRAPAGAGRLPEGRPLQPMAGRGKRYITAAGSHRLLWAWATPSGARALAPVPAVLGCGAGPGAGRELRELRELRERRRRRLLPPCVGLRPGAPAARSAVVPPRGPASRGSSAAPSDAPAPGVPGALRVCPGRGGGGGLGLGGWGFVLSTAESVGIVNYGLGDPKGLSQPKRLLGHTWVQQPRLSRVA